MSNLERLSLGHTVLAANCSENNAPVITANYVSPNYEMPLPEPAGDWYLRQTFVPAVRPGEIVICHTLIDGLLEYYQHIGLVDRNSQVIQVEPGKEESSQFGFPNTDPLELMRGNVRLEDERLLLTLCSTFRGQEIKRQADDLGLYTIGSPEMRPEIPSTFTNNKARLREKSSKYGFFMPTGEVFYDWDSLESAVHGDWNTSFGTWLKFPTGSGGDLIYRIPRKATAEDLRLGVRTLRDAVSRSFSQGQFDMHIDDFWPENAVCPSGLPLVLEADVRLHGSVLINGSTQFVTDYWRGIRIIGHYEQITTDLGEYLGNEPFINASKQIISSIERQIRAVGIYNMSEHGYYGIQGVDWFLVRVRGCNEYYMPIVTELNSRPTANTPPVIIADKLDATHWININAYTEKPIVNFRDYVEVIGHDFVYGNPASNGMVVPQAFRSLVRRSGVEASPNFKVLILGTDRSHCREIMRTLENRGIKLSPS